MIAGLSKDPICGPLEVIDVFNLRMEIITEWCRHSAHIQWRNERITVEMSMTRDALT